MSDKEKNKRIAERFYQDKDPIGFVEDSKPKKRKYKINDVTKEEFFKILGKKKGEE